jgi:hypothetical protein
MDTTLIYTGQAYHTGNLDLKALRGIGVNGEVVANRFVCVWFAGY